MSGSLGVARMRLLFNRSDGLAAALTLARAKCTSRSLTSGQADQLISYSPSVQRWAFVRVP